jgi:hypothetical protein
MGAPKGNVYALGNKGGRPPMYDSPEELATQVNSYFGYCKKSDIKATITGLALYLGFCSRQSLEDYVEKEEFTYIIKRAKLAVENSYELSGQTIDIFALKNMGWKDKSEQEIKVPQGLTVNYNLQNGNAPLNDAD